MLERLQKIISAAGIASRREAERYIVEGRVAVNGVVVTELGAKADPVADRITFDGSPIRIPRGKRYILLNKPVGYVTTMKDPEGRPVVSDLLKGVEERLYPVGRLDYNTEGLLLLTNDGEWANRLMHPRHEVEKEYLVRVRGTVAPQQVMQLIEGVELEDGKTAPAKVDLGRETGSNAWMTITIHEGKYRQVRRMCEAVGVTVVRLKRIRYGGVEIGPLKSGEFRDLTYAEVELLGGKVSRRAAEEPAKQKTQGEKPHRDGRRPQYGDARGSRSPGAGAADGRKPRTEKPEKGRSEKREAQGREKRQFDSAGKRGPGGDRREVRAPEKREYREKRETGGGDAGGGAPVSAAGPERKIRGEFAARGLVRKPPQEEPVAADRKRPPKGGGPGKGRDSRPGSPRGKR